MGLETGTTIASLNASWPLGTDPKSQGDDHLRLIKGVMINDALSRSAGGTVANQLTVTGGLVSNNQYRIGVTGTADVFNDLTYYNASNFIRTTGYYASVTGPQMYLRGAWSAATDTVLYTNWGGVTKFIVEAQGTVRNATGVYATISDASLKERITDAKPKLADLNALRVVNYHLTEGARGLAPDVKMLGFVAQEFEQVFPALVDTDADGVKSIKTSVLIPALVKALQELTSRVEALEA